MSEKSTKDVETKAETTLTTEDITAERHVGRRSMLSSLGATALGAVAVATGGCFVSTPVVRTRTGYTDADPGDGAGNGRGPGAVVVTRTVTGITDGDGGATSDPGGNGRGAPSGMGTGMTDGDSGRYSDPAGAGRGPTHR